MSLQTSWLAVPWVTWAASDEPDSCVACQALGLAVVRPPLLSDHGPGSSVTDSAVGLALEEVDPSYGGIEVQ